MTRISVFRAPEKRGAESGSASDGGALRGVQQVGDVRNLLTIRAQVCIISLLCCKAADTERGGGWSGSQARLREAIFNNEQPISVGA